jgi:hypothetical protein
MDASLCVKGRGGMKREGGERKKVKKKEIKIVSAR